MEQLSKFLPLLGIPSIYFFVKVLISSIALLRATSIERILQSEQQRITTFSVQTIYASISVAILTVSGLIMISPNEELNFVIALFVAVFLISSFLVPVLVSVINLFKRKIMYKTRINDQTSGILEDYYVIKTISTGEVLLSKKPHITDQFILIKREDLLNKLITKEHVKT